MVSWPTAANMHKGTENLVTCKLCVGSLGEFSFTYFPASFQKDLLLCGINGCYEIFSFALVATWPTGVRATSRYII